VNPPRRRSPARNGCAEQAGAPSWRVVSDSADDPRRILAMGGGGFTMQERSPALDRLVLTLTGKEVPRVCFLPTASGDPREQTTRFFERFAAWPCEPSILSLFHLARDRIDPLEHLLAQDAIYVGGGSMRNMLAIWREHSVDEAMRAAWERGVVLAGLSAGAMCWFRGGVTESGGAPAPVDGLGLLEGSLSVHMDGEPERLPVFRAAVASGRLEPGYAADDGAALLFAGTHLQACVASDPAARVIRVAPGGPEGTELKDMPMRLLAGPQAVGTLEEESRGVSELRALRAGRHRWD
jgi:peptidase E